MTPVGKKTIRFFHVWTFKTSSLCIKWRHSKAFSDRNRCWNSIPIL